MAIKESFFNSARNFIYTRKSAKNFMEKKIRCSATTSSNPDALKPSIIPNAPDSVLNVWNTVYLKYLFTFWIFATYSLFFDSFHPSEISARMARLKNIWRVLNISYLKIHLRILFVMFLLKITLALWKTFMLFTLLNSYWIEILVCVGLIPLMSACNSPAKYTKNSSIKQGLV